MQNKGKNPGRKLSENPVKLDKTMALIFHSEEEKKGEIPRRWWTDGNENGDDSVSVSTHLKKWMAIQIQAKSTTQVASQNSYWRI